MASRKTRTLERDAKGLDTNLIPHADIQGLDLADYTTDGKSLPLIIPAHLSGFSQLVEEAEEESAHPLHSLGILDYYPESTTESQLPKSRNRRLTRLSVPTPPPPPPEIPDFIFPFPDNERLSVEKVRQSYPRAFEQFEKALVEMILMADIPENAHQTKKASQNRNVNDVSIPNTSRCDNSQDVQESEKEQKGGVEAYDSSEASKPYLEEIQPGILNKANETAERGIFPEERENPGTRSRGKTKKKGQRKKKGGKKKKGKK